MDKSKRILYVSLDVHKDSNFDLKAANPTEELSRHQSQTPGI